MRGAFTGATDRVGWLEECGGPGTVNAVFLDEIGELDQAVPRSSSCVCSRIGNISKSG